MSFIDKILLICLKKPILLVDHNWFND